MAEPRGLLRLLRAHHEVLRKVRLRETFSMEESQAASAAWHEADDLLRSLSTPGAPTLAEWYEPDGTVTMLPYEEVTRRRKLAAKVIGAAASVVAKVDRIQDALDKAPIVPGQKLLPRDQRESAEHKALRAALRDGGWL
jgi:hypothetical protein